MLGTARRFLRTRCAAGLFWWFAFANQDFIGFGNVLEFVFRVRVGISVRVKFKGQLAIGELDFLCARAGRNVQHAIIDAELVGVHDASKFLSDMLPGAGIQ